MSGRSSGLRPSEASAREAIVLLALAAFNSGISLRCVEPMLPQLAGDFGTSVSAASFIVTAFALAYAAAVLLQGPLGDRFGKLRVVTIGTALAGVTSLACAAAWDVSSLAAARFLMAIFASAPVALGMAYIGDVTPYERRQQVLARYMSGQITGQLFGQAAGGIIGDLLGWRAMFFVLAAMFAVAALALFRELATNPMTRPAAQHEGHGLMSGYAMVLASPWARILMLAVACETALTFGAFAYIGADLHLRFGLSFTWVGVVVGTFGVGGLIYALTAQQLVPRLGQTGLALYGSVILGLAYLTLALAPAAWIAPIAVTLIGLGFYMLHNTLQTNATQVTPQARGTAVALFSAAVYFGQTVGVALIAPVIDGSGGPPVFLVVALLLPVLGWWFTSKLKGKSDSVT